eukprot:CAMPEP_0198245620 /NCGR_PEP_ID=MMETSP1446-20131203/41936_1 /TAXON_ID=1461542 ORGANISM="Unidentified sp, Strain CCMP2111" /NCGR_SAMPLE_ID=MMETSP1446 /ASSEMBLY_ACC=CAM_ASM_001112 /LENGTH=35 /DNA_ID= /DNA_START= /DNA_END= /DNA_ORIENTATION=
MARENLHARARGRIPHPEGEVFGSREDDGARRMPL